MALKGMLVVLASGASLGLGWAVGLASGDRFVERLNDRKRVQAWRNSPARKPTSEEMQALRERLETRRSGSSSLNE